MHYDLLSPYHHRPGAIHRLPAGIKLGGAAGCVFAVVLMPRNAWLACALLGAGLLGVAILSEVPLRRLGTRLLVIEPFVVCVALLSLFQRNGLEIFLAMLTKSTICLVCIVLLAATTRFSDVIRVLWRLRVPSLLVTTLALMYRYLFVLFDEMGRMLRARRCRTFSSRRSLVWQSSSAVAAHLFVRASERAERIYAALCARGWKT